MLRNDLARKIQERVPGTSITSVEKVIRALEDTVVEVVASGEEVSLRGFGKFIRAKRAARKGRNPRTGEEVKIPARNAPKFKPGSYFTGAM